MRSILLALAVSPAFSTYFWSPSNFTECSVSCGSGTRTRTVDCIDSTTDSVVPPANCNEAPPHQFYTEEACHADDCPKFTWVADPWDVCSADCHGTQTRVVRCISSIDNETVTSGCNLEDKLSSEQGCSKLQPCAEWVAEDWDECSQSCGGGTQTRAVSCLDDEYQPSADCTDEQPATIQNCNTSECESYRSVSCSEYFPCTAQCLGGGGIGFKYQDALCFRNSDSVSVDTAFCKTDNPPINILIACNVKTCQNYNWLEASSWSLCALQNNGLYQRNRTFDCRAPNGSTALWEQCVANAGPLPLAVLPCTPGVCTNSEGATNPSPTPSTNPSPTPSTNPSPTPSNPSPTPSNPSPTPTLGSNSSNVPTCPTSQIADVFKRCTFADIQSCAFSASTLCGNAVRVLDAQFVTLGVATRSSFALSCVNGYVSTLESTEQINDVIIYVKSRLGAGQDICGALNGANSFTSLQPIALVAALAMTSLLLR